MYNFQIKFEDDTKSSVIPLYSEGLNGPNSLVRTTFPERKLLGSLVRTADGGIGFISVDEIPDLKLASESGYSLYFSANYNISHNRMYMIYGTISDHDLTGQSIPFKLLKFNPEASL